MTTVKKKRNQLKELQVRFAQDGARSRGVYLTLRTAIFMNVLKENERLTERWLSEVLQVSRTPVREALHRLEAESLLRNVPKTGLVVSSLTLADIEDIYSIRISLEGLAAYLAARRASESDIAVLEALQDQIEAAQNQGNIKVATTLNAQFHDFICRGGKNQRLADFANLLHDSVQRVGSTTLEYPGRANQAAREHRAIIEAIKRGDAETSKRLAEEHMANAKSVRLAMYARIHGRVAWNGATAGSRKTRALMATEH